MKRMWAVLAAFVILSFPLTVSAGEPTDPQIQWESSGASDLWETLPEETRRQLEALGVSEESLQNAEGLQSDQALVWLISAAENELSGPLTAGLMVLGIVLLCALVGSLRFLSDNESIRSLFQSIATLAVCGFLLTSLSELLQRVGDAVESSVVFLSSFVPVYAALLAAGGQITAAVSYQSTVLWAGELLMLVMSGVILPVLLTVLALGTVGSVSPSWGLQKIGSGIGKACGWGMGIISSFFSGLLSLQTIAGAAADTVSGRAIRFSVANLIPVVGGALSDAMLTLKGCLTAVRSTVGVFGILVTAVILLPPIFACMAWSLMMSVCGYTAEVFSLDTVAALTRSTGTVLKTMIALLVMCAVFLTVAMTVLMRAGGTS